MILQILVAYLIKTKQNNNFAGQDTSDKRLGLVYDGIRLMFDVSFAVKGSPAYCKGYTTIIGCDNVIYTFIER